MQIKSETMNLDIRPLQDGDSHHLLNIDLKASEFPFEFEDWQLLAKYFSEWQVLVGCLSETPVAFAIVEFDSDERLVTIHRIVALPHAQQVGVDSAILASIEQQAFVEGFKKIEIPVPDCQCRGKDDPYDLSQWLIRNKYKYIRTQEKLFEGYGDDMDGYIFEKFCDIPEQK